MATPLEVIASELLKSAIDAEKLFGKTKDQSYKDKAVRLRRIVVNLQELTIGTSSVATLNDLTDVTISAAANGQVLTYNSTSGQWENQTPAGAGGTGDMSKSTYDVDNDGVVDSAERTEIIVRNSTGTTLTKGQVVYLSGATGNRPNAVLSQANTEATSSKTIGIVVANIANNSDGYVATNGTLHDLDTSAFADGVAVWLSATTAGAFTSTIPAEPNHTVFIGYIARSHPTQGRIVILIQNGYELNELHGVLISSEANNDLLVYETSSTLWKNKSISTIFGGTPLVSVPTLDQVTTAGNTTTNAITVGGLNVNGIQLITSADVVNRDVGPAAFSVTNGTFSRFNLVYDAAVARVNILGTSTEGLRIEGGSGASITKIGSGGIVISAPSNNLYLNGGSLLLATGNVERARINSSGNFLIGTTTDAGYKLDVNGTARTSQLHTFSQGTYLDALSSNYFYTADTGGATYGGLSLKNSIQNYNAIIYTGRSGASNGIVFEHLTYSGTPTTNGSQVFTQTYTTFGRFNNGTYGHTLYIHQRSGGIATYPLVISNGINTTNSGVGILMQTADSTATGPVNSASIVSWKQNLTAPNVTSDMRFSTISDAANTLSEKMRISSAGNLLVGTTTDGTAKLTVAGSITAASLLAQGVYFNNTLIAAANNDVLVGLDINPTFTNGAFTGVQNMSLRVNSQDGTVAARFVSTSGSLYIVPRLSSTYGTYIGTHNSTQTAQIPLSLSANRFIFDNGNVLIGTPTDAGYKLDVNGTIRSSGTNGLILYDGTYGAKVSMSSYIFTIEKEGSYGVSTYQFKYNDNSNALYLSGLTSIIGLGGGDDGVMMSRNVYARADAAFGFTSYGATTKYKAIQALYTDNNTSGVAFNFKTGGTDTEAMRINSAGNVLVGTTTNAGYKLDVNGSARVGSLGLYGNNGTITAPLIKFNGSNQVNVDPQGYGIVTNHTLTTGNYILSSGGGIRSNGSFGAKSSTSVVSTPFISYGISRPDSDASVNPLGGMGGVHDGVSSWAQGLGLVFYTSNGPDITGSGYLTEKMRLSSVGNLGLGTNNPIYPLHISSAAAANIYGTVQSTSASGTAAWVAFNDQSDNVVYRVFGSGASGTQMGIALARSASLMANLGGSGKFLLGTYSNTDFIMGTGNAEKMRIVDSTGNILIATTTDLGNKLEVNGNINSTGYSLNNTAGYTGTLVIVTNPPGQQNIDIRGGIIVNVF